MTFDAIQKQIMAEMASLSSLFIDVVPGKHDKVRVRLFFQERTFRAHERGRPLKGVILARADGSMISYALRHPRKRSTLQLSCSDLEKTTRDPTLTYI